MTDILQNISKIEQRIQKACRENNRHRDEVKLLLATKTVPASRIKIAIEAGYTLIAENRIQEVKEKYDELKSIKHTSHFIGHLQSNKIKELLRYDISCLHSLDRITLAEKLDRRLKFENKQLDVLIQVNTSFEESKFGVHPQNAPLLVEQVSRLGNIRIKGLMTIGLFSADTEKVRKCFRLLKNLSEKIKNLQFQNVEMKELSMGMSQDLETAIAEGATIIRVGTAIFGQRDTPDSFYWNENK